jgi:hypothetical protein
MKQCGRCKKTKPLSDFYYRNGKRGKEQASYCKDCQNLAITERRRKLKEQCIEYLGRSCKLCGYDKYSGALDFHHKDPTQKDFNFAKFRRYKFMDKLRKELDKCILLCSSCHREVHGNLHAEGGSLILPRVTESSMQSKPGLY